NYGPWDRLAGNQPFIDNIGTKPAGANFYPSDMSREEFDSTNLEGKTSQYTFIRRDENGKLMAIPYSVQFAEEVKRASDLLLECAELAEDAGFKTYLTLRAQALLDDNYQPSDFAWMDMKTNAIDVVIGPIENYEDGLYNYKAAHEAYVLLKDQAWSERLVKYAAYLPELQLGLPVPDAYKQETPGADADLNAYDVVYYAGDCNAGSKTIAINLPNDEHVQLEKGSRRLQLKNAMKAKYEKIMVPIASQLIAEDQQPYITFDAFFANTMFHEVAHGLGIKNTINDQGTVRQAIKEHFSALEEGKADVLGLYMITQLHQKGELEGRLEDYYTTFMAGIFRSVRFGASSAHGKANMIRFNFFQEMGAFAKDTSTGRYRVDFEKMTEAMNALSELILTLQGDGNYEGVAQLVAEKGIIKPELQNDLEQLAAAGIPVDIIFEQGVEILGL
ncbi:MAG: Zn-dependent hydrolase, partial [Cyclobacteriaceae bacterium]|nr:Zn-dependent hydrolase [Cyclobacteriaceae bacterium]